MMYVIVSKDFDIELAPTQYEFSKRKLDSNELAIQVWSSRIKAETFLNKHNKSGAFKIYESEKKLLVELIRKKYGKTKIELDAE